MNELIKKNDGEFYIINHQSHGKDFFSNYDEVDYNHRWVLINKVEMSKERMELMSFHFQHHSLFGSGRGIK